MELKQNMTPTLRATRYPSLDGLRAISITLVVLSHLSDAFTFSPAVRNYITLTGVLGVQVFFVISGFLITSLLLKEKAITGTISLRQFYVRRLLRIMPVAMLYLVCLFVVDQIFHLQVPLKCFAGAVFFLYNLDYFHGSWYTAHYWSLSIEEQYYFVFPFLLKKMTRHIHFLLFFFIAFIIFLRGLAYSGHFPDWQFLKMFGLLVYQSDGVLIGSLVAVLNFKKLISLTFFKKYTFSLCLLTPVLAWLFHAGIIGLSFLNPALSCGFISIFVLCNIVDEPFLIFSFLNNKYVMLVGKLSFSIYIWQQFFTSTDGRFGRLNRLPINIILIAIVSYFSYYFFETRFLKLKAKFSYDGKQERLRL